MADELEHALGVSATLVSSSGGAFEITVDGKLIFSKLQSERFPQDGEIVKKIKD
ncbi:MAG: SelT/SelW/SelH family protein [bacterium]|nr:SelT/SelW/SelH family protein [bacterium]